MQNRVFVNGDFEQGTANSAPTGWTLSTFLDPGVTISTPQSRAGLNLGTGGVPLTLTLSAPGGPESQSDPSLGNTASLRWPKYGNQVAIVNQLGNNRNVNSLQQTMTVAQADIDSLDGLVHVRFVVAPVLENPNHAAAQQPYYFVQLTNITRNLILYNDYNASAQPGVPWKISNGYYYTDWQLVDIAPGSASLAVGDQIGLEVIGSGCSLGGHFGHVYVDGVGSAVPGPFVSATGPAAANAGSNITYTLNYKNGGTGGVGGTVVEFNTPPSTTFQSFNAPGLSCTAPAVGTAGLVSCTVGVLAPGATGSFTVTAQIDPAATGTITAGNYDILGTAVSPLLGPKVLTTVTNGVVYSDLGITISNGLGSLVWGEPVKYTIVATNQGPNDVVGATVTNAVPANLVGATWVCVATGLGSCGASGTGSINDTISLPVGETATYTVTATVAPGSGGSTLQDIVTIAVPAGASDSNPANNSAGDNDAVRSLNGVSCSIAGDCVSGVCDPKDQLCGDADGDGPCLVATGPLVCRSGACSVNGLCEPAGGCNVDADCTGGDWCAEASHVCTPQLANGVPLPNDPSHDVPVLSGVCTADAAKLVCKSGVCDTDNACGFLNGDGPCGQGAEAAVCRGGGCSLGSNLCTPIGGCTLDADCSSNDWCNDETFTCVPKLVNGTPIPMVGGHAPPLAGLCTALAGTAVCASGVCDLTLGTCGLGTGIGPCTTSAPSVCQSGACSTNGTCEPAGGCNVDADCAADQWCDSQNFTCVAKFANGKTIPTVTGHTPALIGKCAADVATSVCASGVCDAADDACGYVNGDGPCTALNAGMVCRAGACSVALVCMDPAACTTDGDCSDTQYCNTAGHVCAVKVVNGTALPSVAGHQPALDGTCSDASAKITCQSGVCDTTDNKCGYPIAKGPCDAANGAVVCRSAVCATTGASKNTCVECLTNTECKAALPVCNTTKNACVQCTATENGACAGSTPVCATVKETCVACGGDVGDKVSTACLTSAAPFCSLTGATKGTCGKCATNADCVGHSGGAFCDSGSGACGTACHADGDCDAASYCNAPAKGAGLCVPKLDNGSPLPSAPSEVATCSTAVGTRVCKSGVCDTADNTCGFSNGNGPCSDQAVCRSGVCDGKDQKCGLLPGDGPCKSDSACRAAICDMVSQTCGQETTGCKTDTECPQGDYCKGDGACAPKLPTGDACSRANECESDTCTDNLCDATVASGNGLLCAASPRSGSGPGDGAAIFGLAFALAGLARRRRR